MDRRSCAIRIRREKGPAIMKELLTEQETAKLLHVAVKTLQGWRHKGGGPLFAKMGRLVRYSVKDLEAFVDDQRRRSTSDRGERPAYQLPRSEEHTSEL